MKKLLFFFVATAIVVACSEKEALNMEFPIPAKQQVNNIRSFEEALEVAQKSIELLNCGDSSTTRGTMTRMIDTDNSKIYRKKTTRSSSSFPNDTLMYIFNFNDNQGFAIVSASYSTEELIAVTEKGHFDPNISSEIEGFNLFMEMAEKYIANSTTQRGPFDPIQPPYLDSIVDINIQRGPYVTVQWGQTHPEGEYCPNGISGCVNTAMAQIMSYYNYPLSIDLTYDNADISVQALNWTDIKTHQTGHLLNTCSTPDTHKAIGRLCRQLGYMNNSSYGTNITTTLYNNAVSTMASLGYSIPNNISFDFNSIMNQLNSQHLFMITGSRIGESVGHAWVLDGYKYIETGFYRLEPIGLNGEWIITDSNVTITRLCHYNWGWYGDCNGYFSAGVFDTQAGVLYDGAHIADRDYCVYVRLYPMYYTQ